MIEKGIYIESQKNRGNKNIDSFDYYVCGLKIGDENYTVKFVISKKNNGERYYDHKLIEIEKGRLLDLSAVSSAGSANKHPLNSYKDKRLFSILQINPKEIAKAETRMRQILDEVKQLKGYSDDSSYQGTSAFNGAAPSSNAYFPTRAERRAAIENETFEGEVSFDFYWEKNETEKT